LENASGNAHHTLIFADAYTELDDGSLEFQRASGGKRKNMSLRESSANVLPNMPRTDRSVDSPIFGGYSPTPQGQSKERHFSNVLVKPVCSKRLDGSAEDQPKWRTHLRWEET
jgi:hypothetical protein